MNKNLTIQMRELFIDGKNLTEISEILGVSRVTVHNHKEKDEKNSGISWEELQLKENRTPANMAAKEAIFLNSLFRSFDKFRRRLI